MSKSRSRERFYKILVVDDITANLQMLTNVLTKQGYTVYPASDGELALEFLRTTLPDLVLLDIRMPGIDGFEVCRRLKNIERTRAVPVIFISILENEGDKVKGFRAGAVDYITKPLRTEEVLARVKTHLRLHELTVQLEQEVRNRSGELITSNQQLQQELVEREKAQAKLASEQALLRCLIDSVSDLIFIKDLNGIYRGCNKASEAFIGIPESEQIGKTDSDFFDPEKAKEIEKDDNTVLETGKPLRIEEWVTARDGSQILMDTIKAPYYNSDGEVLGLVGIARDITERRQAVQALEETANRLKETQRLAHIGGWELDIVNNVLTWSEEVFHIFEIDSDTLNVTYETFLDAVHPDDRESVDLAYKDSLKTKTAFSIDHRLLLADGRIKHVHIQCSSFYDGEKAIRSVGTAQDITERKQVEELNEARLHLIQFAATHSLDKFLEETLNVAERLTQSNISFFTFIGADQLSLSLQNWSTRTKAKFSGLVDKDLHSKVSEAGIWAECVTQGKPIMLNDCASIPQRRRFPRGDTKLVRELVAPILRDGKVRALISVCNKPHNYHEADADKLSLLADFTWEIAERKRTEGELARYHNQLEDLVQERTAELEASNKALEAFAYSISHDLRGPLRHIDGFLDLLRNATKAELDDESRRYMDIISNTAIKMGSMIDNLLSFSRMGSKKMSFQQVALDKLVKEVIRDLKPDTYKRKISWQIGKLSVVNGDPSMLKIVLTNLISNALKFTRHRPKAHIEVKSRSGRDSETVISVQDNGVGFDMKFTDKLFGVFQRLHHADEFEGTGIGLANVRRIVTRHGGRTWAKGEIDQGATFYFSLPLHSSSGRS